MHADAGSVDAKTQRNTRFALGEAAHVSTIDIGASCLSPVFSRGYGGCIQLNDTRAVERLSECTQILLSKRRESEVHNQLVLLTNMISCSPKS